MSTQTRLEAYYAAELRILTRGQSLGLKQGQVELAELAEIRKAIRTLEAQLQLEHSAASGGGTLSFATVDFRSGA